MPIDDKITQLPLATTLADDDIDATVQDVTTTPITRGRTLSLLKSTLKAFFDTLYASIATTSALQILFTHGNNSAVPAGATRFLNLHFSGLSASANNISVTRPCTIKNLYVSTNSTQPATGTLVFTIQKNNSNTALIVTVPINGAAGTYSNVSDAVTLGSGDSIQLAIVNNASADSALVIRCAVELLF